VLCHTSSEGFAISFQLLAKNTASLCVPENSPPIAESQT